MVIIKLLKKDSKGFTLIETIVIILIIAGLFYFLTPTAIIIKKSVEEKYAVVILRKIEDITERLNLKIPDYAYTDVKDNSPYINELKSYLKEDMFDESTNKGIKITVQKEFGTPAFWFEFKDARRIRFSNGEVDPVIYYPEDSIYNYGRPWLYKYQK